MPDEADQAIDLAAEHLAHSLARIDAAIPAGAPGECENCGDEFARLVDGLCGFCRDGRRPLAAAADRQASAPATAGTTRSTKEKTMPEFMNIAVHIRADLAPRFRAFQEKHELTQSKAGSTLIEQALAADKPPVVQQPAKPADITTFDTADLLDELERRVKQGGRAGDLERDLAEANDRAKAAEEQVRAAQAQLATISGVISGHIQPTGGAA